MSSKANSTTPTKPDKSRKPAKPYPSFPLYPHASGRWAKKIRGKTMFFGPWSDPDGALRKYRAESSDLHAGRTPRETEDELTVKGVCNQFLTYKQSLLQSGELAQRTYDEYLSECQTLILMTGRGRLVADLRTDDFTAIRSALAKRLGPVALGNQIQRIRSVFKFALDMGLIKSPMIFGAGFKRPTKKVLRLERKKRGPKLFEREEIHKLLTTAGPCMRAMILLGINCGFGNADVGQLPIDALDLKTGWVNYHRSKTGIDRRCHLWPETVAALEKAIAIRTEPSDPEHANLVFLTKRRLPWFKPTKSNPLCHEFQKLVQLAGLKPGRGFYCFRHGFETIGGASRDQVAVNAVMGHADESMAANYRERIEDDRLIAVSNHVHSWLYGKPAG